MRIIYTYLFTLMPHPVYHNSYSPRTPVSIFAGAPALSAILQGKTLAGGGLNLKHCKTWFGNRIVTYLCNVDQN